MRVEKRDAPNRPGYGRYGLPLTAGGCAYLAALSASQALQLGLRINTGTPLLPSLLGVGSVCVASAVGTLAADAVLQLEPGRRRSLMSVYGDAPASVAAALTGVYLHAVAGPMRFWSLSPSSLASRGAFAWRKEASLPATEKYASTAVRAKLQDLGRRFGCHTCGTRFAAGLYIGDHVPPLAMPDRRLLLRLCGCPPITYRFHPQCPSCSSLQSTAMARVARGQTGRAAAGASVFHWPSPLRPTSYVGVALVAITLAADAKIPAALIVVSMSASAANQAKRCIERVRSELELCVERVWKASAARKYFGIARK